MIPTIVHVRRCSAVLQLGPAETDDTFRLQVRGRTDLIASKVKETPLASSLWLQPFRYDRCSRNPPRSAPGQAVSFA